MCPGWGVESQKKGKVFSGERRLCFDDSPLSLMQESPLTGISLSLSRSPVLVCRCFGDSPFLEEAGGEEKVKMFLFLFNWFISSS